MASSPVVARIASQCIVLKMFSQACYAVDCSTVSKEKSSTCDREELRLKTFSYHVDENAEDELADPALSKPGRQIYI